MGREVVQIKGTRQGLVIRLYPRADIQAVKTDLTSKLESANGFFQGAKYLLDREQQAIPDNEQRELEELLCRYGLVPAKTMPLPVSEAPRRARPPQREASVPELPAGGAPARLVKHSLRSGQAVQNPDGHVVVLGSVHPGAKIEAGDGVVVFGECRGNVFAGTGSKPGACVVSRSFHGTLVAINGVIGYPQADPEPERFLKASLHEGQIVVDPLK